MEIWVDAQLPPKLALSIQQAFSLTARHVESLGMVTASDLSIFMSARKADAIVLTKDTDFVRLLEREGPPPRILWLTTGNMSNSELWLVLTSHWHEAMAHFAAGESLVEIGRRS